MVKRVKVKVKLNIYEIDDKECGAIDRPQLVMRSHWNDNSLVVVQMPDGTKITISARDLRDAMGACT